MVPTALLVGLLLPGAAGAPLGFQHVSTALAPARAPLRVAFTDRTAAMPWARHGDTIVVRRRASLLVVAASTLRRLRSIPLPATIDCALGFDGPTVVIVTGCASVRNHRHLVLRIDPERGVISHTVASFPLGRGLDTTFGDGHVYVARPGRVDVVDERTGRVVTHPARRSLAKDGGFVRAAWIGDHLIAINATIRDARTWQLWAVLRGGMQVSAGPADLVAYGPAGASVYTRRGRLRYRVLRGEDVNAVTIVGRTMFASVGAAVDVVDLAAGRRTAVRLAYFAALLAP